MTTSLLSLGKQRAPMSEKVSSIASLVGADFMTTSIFIVSEFKPVER